MPAEAEPRLHSAEPWLGLFVLVLLASGLAALFANWRQGGGAALALVLAAILVPTGVVIAHTIRQSYYHPRYFTVVMPIYCLMLALGILALYRQWPWVGRISLVVLVVASSASLTLTYTDPLAMKSRDKAYMTRILQDASPHDALLLVGRSTANVERYGSDRLGRVVHVDSVLRTQSRDEVEQSVAEIAATHRYVWLAVYGPSDTAFLHARLKAQGQLVQSFVVAEVNVAAYSRSAPPVSPTSTGKDRQD